MKKSSYPAPAKIAAAVHTYRFDGKILNQAQMLALTTKCSKVGEVTRFVLSKKSDLPAGTLMDKRNPLHPLKSIQAQQMEEQARRRQEGHRFAPAPRVLHPDSQHVPGRLSV